MIWCMIMLWIINKFTLCDFKKSLTSPHFFQTALFAEYEEVNRISLFSKFITFLVFLVFWLFLLIEKEKEESDIMTKMR